MHSNKKELERVLGNVIADHGEAFEAAQWPWEIQRWYQLTYSLMCAVEGSWRPDNISTSALEALVNLDLVDPAAIGADSWADEDRQLAELVLIRKGFSPGDAATITTAVRQVAVFIRQNWEGHIQRYLRAIGNDVIDRIIDEMPLGGLDQEAASLAMTHWLQDVFGLPVLVDSPPLVELMGRTTSTRSDVLDILDDIGVNVALVDEILTTRAGYPEPADDLPADQTGKLV